MRRGGALSGAAPIIVTDGLRGNNPALFLNNSIFIGKTHFIRSFSQLVPRNRIAGHAIAAGAQTNAKSPQERYENEVLSISTEPIFCLIFDPADF
jgi:hypothetical protein